MSRTLQAESQNRRVLRWRYHRGEEWVMTDVKQQLAQSIQAIEQAELIVSESAIECRKRLTLFTPEMSASVVASLVERFREAMGSPIVVGVRNGGISHAILELLRTNPTGLTASQITSGLVGKYLSKSPDHHGLVKASLRHLKISGQVVADTEGRYTATGISRARKERAERLYLITQFFKDNGNEWAQIPVIAKVTGLRTTSARDCMRSSKHKTIFEYQRDKGTNKTVWRMKITPGK